MSYKIHFVGLACFVKLKQEYLVLLPNGIDGGIPSQRTSVDGEAKGEAQPETTTHSHRPYLIIPTTHVTPCTGETINKCCVIELKEGTTLDFPFGSNDIDATYIEDVENALHWKEIDPDFEPHLDGSGAVVKVPLYGGTVVSRRMLKVPGVNDPAVIHEVTIELTGSFSLTIDGNSFQVAEGAEIIVANVERDWIDCEKFFDDDLRHFLLYYRIDKGAGKHKRPKVKRPPFTDSKHPYLSRDIRATGREQPKDSEDTIVPRSLQIACSNTTYP